MCVLRASGKDFDPGAFLASAELSPVKIFRRGEPRLPRSQPAGPRFERSGFTIVVSEASRSSLSAQVADAEAFLHRHAVDLQRLAANPDVENLVLDFPIDLRIGHPKPGEPTSGRVWAQFDRFPATLVEEAAKFRLALELSLYEQGGE